MDKQTKAALAGSIIGGLFVIFGIVITLVVTNNFPHLMFEDQYWNQQGDTLNSLGNEAQAIQALDKALLNNPSNKYAWRNKATAFSRLGNYEAALQAINKSIDIDPKYTLALVDKCIYLVRLNRYSEVDEALMKAEDSLLA
jgi:tetratricopeptide (TPR) repeat protein